MDDRIKPRTLNDLQATEKQSPEDVSNNQWFFPFVNKLCSLGSSTMSMQQFSVLCFIAKQGTNGALTKDICGAMDTTLSSIQRQLGRLSEGYEFKKGMEKREREGLNLLENFEDPLFRKQYRWVLNKKGVRFFKQLNSVIVRYDG
jgi:DNA-binding MarR family transcriptional regulator